MSRSKKSKKHPQFPDRGFFSVLNPSYLQIGGSGVVGIGNSESPMSSHEMSETPAQEAAEDASGSGAAAGASITSAGSGVA